MKHTTECNTCGGGTGQTHPCICSTPKMHAMMQQRKLAAKADPAHAEESHQSAVQDCKYGRLD